MLGGSGDADGDDDKDLTEFYRGQGPREDLTTICLPRFNFEALTWIQV